MTNKEASDFVMDLTREFAPCWVAVVIASIIIYRLNIRRYKRHVILGLMFFNGLWLVFLGNYWEVNYMGYGMCAVGMLGLCGVNIWKGGALDPRRDTEIEARQLKTSLIEKEFNDAQR
ncbi:hypothetical protein HYR69_08440 [Candidatus Sumerlaeota bacterium]|nr:hypothetical protein [Candidatus Sumerlaeota bacterium]MBI3735856.1 hypothetical protein [Candidatus Sumerlaeota bacterium]